MDNQILIDIQANNNASEPLRQLAEIFQTLRRQFEDTRDEMAKGGGLVVPFEGLNKVIRSAQSETAKLEGDMGKLFEATMRHREQLENAWNREDQQTSQRDARRVIEIERQAQIQIAAMERMHQARMRFEATERLAQTQIAGADVQAAGHGGAVTRTGTEKQIIERRQQERELESWDDRFRAHQQAQDAAAQREHASYVKTQFDNIVAARKIEDKVLAESMAAQARSDQAKRKSAEETHFLVQSLNQQTVQMERQRADAIIAEQHRISQARSQAMSGAASALGMQGGPVTQALSSLGGMGGTGGVMGMVGSLAGGLSKVTGPVGIGMNVLGGVAGGALNLLQGGLGVLSSGLGAIGNMATGALGLIPNAFHSIMDAVGGATGELGGFIKQGLLLTGVYQVVNLVEDAFRNVGKTLVDFDFRMGQVNALTVRGSNNMEKYREAIMQTSMETGRSLPELARALFFIESHGVTSDLATHVLDRVAKASASGLGDSDDITRIVMGQAAEYGFKGKKNIDRLFDVYARTEQVGSVPPGELAGQVQRLTPVAAALGIEPEQVGGLIATVSQSGLGAGRVVTDIIAMLQSLIDVTPKAQEALKGIGLSVGDLRKVAATPGPEGGIFAVLKLINDKSGGNTDVLGKIFGDGTRAMVGFFSTFKNEGSTYAANVKQMYDATGALDTVWSKMQATLQVQMDRIQAIFFAAGAAISENFIPGVAGWLKGVNDALMEGDITGGVQRVQEGIQQAGEFIWSTVSDLAGKMFGAGGNMMIELANGIMSTAASVITGAAEFAANIVASFLLGSSPPLKGPMHYIAEGTANWMQAKADAMHANEGILGGAAERVAGVVNEQLTKIGDVNAAGSRKGIDAQIDNLDKMLMPWKLAADQVKDSYEAMLHPLERQMDMIKSIKDMEYDRAKLGFEKQDMELRALEIQAEGDPVKRAQLAGQMVTAQFSARQHSMAAEAAGIARQMREPRRHGESAAEYAERQASLRDRQRVLGIERQIEGTRNPVLLAQIAQKRMLLDYDEKGAKLAHDIFEWNQKNDLQPLIEQHDRIKAQMQSELDYIKAQTDGWEDQRKILVGMKNALPPDKAGAAGAGAGGATNWPKIKKDMEDSANTAMDTIIQKYREKITIGFNDFVNSPTYKSLGTSLASGLVGYMIGGFPGALIGLSAGPQFVKALEEYGVTGKDLTDWAARVQANIKAAFMGVSEPLTADTVLGSTTTFLDSLQKWWKDIEGALMRPEFFTNPMSADTQGTIANLGAPPALTEHIGQEMGYGPEGQELGLVSGRPGVSVYDPTFTGAKESRVSPETGAIIPSAGQMSGVAGQRFAEANIVQSPVRRVGPARIILEAVFGREQANTAKTFQDAYKMFDDKYITPTWNAFKQAITELWRRLTAPSIDDSAGGMPKLGASPLQQMLDTLGSTLEKYAVEPITKAGMTIGGFIIDGIAAEIARRGGMWAILWGAGKAAGGGVIKQGMSEIGTGLQTDVAGVQAGGAAVKDTADAVSAAGLPSIPGPLHDANWSAMFTGEGSIAGWLKQGRDSVLSWFTGATQAVTDSPLTKADWWVTHLVQPVKDALGIHSPSSVFNDMAENSITSYQEPFQNDNTTGAILRMWATSEVLSQARSILITGQGKNGGMRGVGADAIDALGEPFGQGLPVALRTSLNNFGIEFVNVLMRPIEDKTDGVLARITTIMDAAAKRVALVPKPAGVATPTPTPTPSSQPAAGGTNPSVDSPQPRYEPPPPPPPIDTSLARNNSAMSFAFPAQVAATAGSNDVNINAPLISVQSMTGGDTGTLDDMLDRVRSFIVEDIRAARGMGVERPGGQSPRGSR